MKELNTQKYLRSGKTLEDLKEELGIKYSIYEDLVVLNYDQINSEKTDPIVMECRSLILQLKSWDIISMAFHRFFNYGEAPEITEKIDFSTATAQEKVDGSIVSVFYHNKRWLMSTRGSIEGQGKVGFNEITFKGLFDKILGKEKEDFYNLLKPSYIYIFELTSLENKVVKVYEDRALYLLGVRDKNHDFKELNMTEFSSYIAINLLADKIKCIKEPQIYMFSDFEDLLILHKIMNASDEGFVVVNYNQMVDGNFMRVKIKNPAYVALAHMKESGGASLRCLLQLIILNEVDEFLIHFPEFSEICEKVQEKYEDYIDKIKKDIILIPDIDELSQKDYAIKVKNMTNSSFMFMLKAKKVKDLDDYFIQQIKQKGVKVIAKNLMKVLNLKDIELIQE